MLDDHGRLSTAHHDRGPLPGSRQCSLVSGLRAADDVDGHSGPRPHESVPQVHDEPALQVARAATAAGGRALLTGLVTEVSPAGRGRAQVPRDQV
ncbi:hypothetical protein, partial [Streptomyces anulatus]|uniref:hypothetical protein n=1 Tax=Streptomyces anulatus TaxID=1892 RepID=UPI0036AF13C3